MIRMTLARQKKRYSGIQSLLKNFAENGCLLLCLLSIIEETNDIEQDFFSFIQQCRAENLVTDKFFVNDALKILDKFTLRGWIMKSVRTLDGIKIGISDFTVEHWHNARTGYDHFRRRYADTLKNSVTVKDGILVEYRIYRVVDV